MIRSYALGFATSTLLGLASLASANWYDTVSTVATGGSYDFERRLVSSDSIDLQLTPFDSARGRLTHVRVELSLLGVAEFDPEVVTPDRVPIANSDIELDYDHTTEASFNTFFANGMLPLRRHGAFRDQSASGIFCFTEKFSSSQTWDFADQASLDSFTDLTMLQLSGHTSFDSTLGLTSNQSNRFFGYGDIRVDETVTIRYTYEAVPEPPAIAAAAAGAACFMKRRRPVPRA